MTARSALFVGLVVGSPALSNKRLRCKARTLRLQDALKEACLARGVWPFLEQLLQEGARKLLQAAIENEVIDYIQFHKDRRDENGQRLVVRNGHLPEREIVSGVGPIRVRQLASSAPR